METFEHARLDAYFARINARFRPAEQPASLLITHLLPERPSFVKAVAAASQLRAVLPEPKSINMSAQREVEKVTQCAALTRELFSDPGSSVDFLESRAAGENIVLLDVGGYFAPTLDTLCDRFSGRILGVVEDTENGHRRYADIEKLPCPVVSVARSPLKDPEDFLVGQSVVFSTEALMRARGDILHGRPALVLGFGKLGSSIARLLHAKGIQVTVYDIDPVRRTQALSQDFTVARDRDAALHDAGLVLCATGSVSLRGEDFSALRNGAYVATVTSSEDETLVGAALRELAEETGIDAHIIPANPAKDEPEHLHFDFRFMFHTTVDDVVLQEEEVTAASWQSADTLVSEPLRSRVLTTMVQQMTGPGRT